MWEQLPVAYHVILITLPVRGTQWMYREVMGARDQGGCTEEGAFSRNQGVCPGLHVTTWTSHCTPLLHSHIILILSCVAVTLVCNYTFILF